MKVNYSNILPNLKEFLDEKVDQYNHPNFIETDPIQIPHQFTRKEDIEISGFLVATIAWGNRKMIIKNGYRLMELMGNSPYEFVMEHKQHQLNRLDSFIHRTFNAVDLKYFIVALNNIYTHHNGLETVFAKHVSSTSTQPAIHEFKKVFFSLEHPLRTKKHISDPFENSAAKRLNMFLRWLIRDDNRGVDIGLWKSISPSILSCPLDVHSGNVARKLGLISRVQNDAKALLELDTCLRNYDKTDPVKYDFALFGLGVFERF